MENTFQNTEWKYDHDLVDVLTESPVDSRSGVTSFNF